MSSATEKSDNRALLKHALLKLDELQGKLGRLSESIAIVGLSCRFPSGADDPEALWQILSDGTDAIRDIPPDRWDVDAYYDSNPGVPGKMYTRRGGFLDSVDRFDPYFFGISPREALKMDPQQRLLLEVAWEALERAGQAPSELVGSRTGVFVGIGGADYAQLQIASGDHENIDTYFAAGAAHSIASGRISYLLGLQGPSVSVDTACSSSLLAVHLACQSLRLGECDMALAGGVNMILSPNGMVAACQTRMLSPDGRCKTFDAGADGYVRAEGCAVVALKRLSDARLNRDNILAVIRGTAANQDGRSNGLTAPNGAAQEAVIREALANSGVKPAEVSYVETHGTGTSLGDPIEVQALGAVFGQGRPPNAPVLIGAVKSNIGHLEAAAGIAGLVKVILALQHKQLPPSLHVKRLNPHIAWEQLPVKVVREPTSWPALDGNRIAGVSSFGFSGTNVHIVVEEAPALAIAPGEIDRPLHVLSLSAKSEAALRELAEQFTRHLAAHPAEPLADVCFTANAGRSHFDHRLAAVALTQKDFSTELRAFVAGENADGLRSGTAEATGRQEIAFLFTGQGAQYVGMGRQLYDTQPSFRRAIDNCDEILRSRLDRSLVSVLYAKPGEASPLDETAYTQPALFALEYALAELWKSWGIVPSIVLGHSVGEYVAACVAGVFSLEDGLRLIAERGRLMQALPKNGSMAVAFADEEKVAAALAPFAAEAAIAALNGPENTVISGERQAVREILTRLKKQGIQSQSLPVSRAFHSPLMTPMLDDFDRVARAATYAPARIGIVSNLTGNLLEVDEAIDASYWRRHTCEPVQFARGVESLHRQGCRIFVEIGPEATLSNIARRLVAGKDSVCLASLRRGRDDWRTMLDTLASLYTQGAEIDWLGFDRDYPRRRLALPTYPFQRESYWLGQEKLRPISKTLRFKQNPERVSKHPLLGAYLNLAHPSKTHVWQGELDLTALQYLGHHRVQGVPLLAAAVYMEMVVAAATKIFGAGCFVLSEVEFLKPLLLADGVRPIIQAIFSLMGEQELAFRIYSRRAGAPGITSAWTLHTTGKLACHRVGNVIEVLEQADIDTIVSRCPEEMSGTDFYRINDARGNQWGPLHQGIEKLWRSEREVVARVRVPTSLEREIEDYLFHPAIADACGQVLAATITLEKNGDKRSAGFVGAGFHQARIFRRPQGLQLWAHGKLKDDGVQETNVLEGDIRIIDETGSVVAELVGVRYRYLDREAPLELEENIDDWLYHIDWRAKARLEGWEVGNGAVPDRGGKWLIFADGRGIAESLAKLFLASGNSSALVFPGKAYERLPEGNFRVRPEEPEDMRRLVSDALGDGGKVSKIVHLWSLDAASSAEISVDALEKAERLGCASVLHLVQALARAGRGNLPRLWLVTGGAQRVGGETAAPSVAQAPLWGFGRALAQEHSELWGGLVDLDIESDASEGSRLLWEEIHSPDGEDQIVLRREQRYVARLARKPLPATPSAALKVHPDAGYLITGGLGGLGLEVARWLVEKGARRLILLGRTKVPPRSRWGDVEKGSRTAAQIAALRKLEVAGASIHLAAIDIADANQVKSFVEAYRRECETVRGVVHAAGVMQYESLLEHDVAKMKSVLRSKILGGWLLHRLFEDIPLDFFVLFSSAASLLSSPLMGSYAAANSFLDALAHYRKVQGLPALSINWGSWSEVGMAIDFDANARRVAYGGMKAIAPRQGLAVLERLLKQDSAQVGVLPMDWPRLRQLSPSFAHSPFLAEVVGEENLSVPDAAGPRFTREALQDAAPEERHRLLENYLAGQLAKALGLSVPTFDLQQPLSTLGFDSLMAVEIKNRIEADLGAVIPIVELLQGPSVAQLATLLLRELAAPAAAATPYWDINGNAGRHGDGKASPGESAAPPKDETWEEGEI